MIQGYMEYSVRRMVTMIQVDVVFRIMKYGDDNTRRHVWIYLVITHSELMTREIRKHDYHAKLYTHVHVHAHTYCTQRARINKAYASTHGKFSTNKMFARSATQIINYSHFLFFGKYVCLQPRYSPYVLIVFRSSICFPRYRLADFCC